MLVLPESVHQSFQFDCPFAFAHRRKTLPMQVVSLCMRPKLQTDTAHANPWAAGQGGVQLQHLPNALLCALNTGETRTFLSYSNPCNCTNPFIHFVLQMRKCVVQNGFSGQAAAKRLEQGGGQAEEKTSFRRCYFCIFNSFIISPFL